MQRDQHHPQSLLRVFDQAWERSGRPGIGPVQLMEQEWTEDSEDKGEFYALHAVFIEGRETPRTESQHFTVVPVLLGRDGDGRPRVSGVVEELSPAPGGGFRFTFHPIKEPS